MREVATSYVHCVKFLFETKNVS